MSLADLRSGVTIVGMDESWDCIVVGAGAAGLSAALVLGRARRHTLVIDAGRPSNLASHGIGGLLGHDGRPPAGFYAAGREELARYPSVVVRDGEVVDGRRDGHGHGLVVTLADDTRETARRVLLATGMDYRFPARPGLAERWGRTVFHCPFCHGWEVRDRPLGVLDRGDGGVHRALLLRAWSDDVTLYADGPAELEDAQRAQLEGAGIAVDERPVAGLRGDAPDLTAVALAGGAERACGGLLVPVTLHQRSDLARRLGATTAAVNPLSAEAIVVDAQMSTDVCGLSAAGDASGQMPSVANAIAAGSTAAAMLVGGLMTEAFAAPAPA
ncbi:MAG TPA: NAD(P)/FAD-dependent oxidoreductase [Baekduia sp.]|nr:NAD(P)/FAD-dependent oxidoreductase [Baekduia sp.]